MTPTKLTTDLEALVGGPNQMPFPKFGSIARLNREVVLTEKIDGTNALVQITRVPLGTSIDFSIPPFIRAWIDDSELDESGMPTYELILRVGSRSRWLSTTDDNFNFAKWVKTNAQELLKLGVGNHYGEWYGQGIQRNYGLTHKRFALFNVSKWGDSDVRPACCDVVPVLSRVNGSELSEAVERRSPSPPRFRLSSRSRLHESGGCGSVPHCIKPPVQGDTPGR